MSVKSTEVRQIYKVSRDLFRVSRLFQRNSVHCGGVTFLQFTILDYLMENKGSLDLSLLHDLLAVEKSTTTRLVQPIIEKKFIQKKISPSDPRAFRLSITLLGKNAHKEYWKCLSETIAKFSNQISKEKQMDIIESLSLYTRGVGNLCGDKCCW